MIEIIGTKINPKTKSLIKFLIAIPKAKSPSLSPSPFTKYLK